MRAPAPPPKPTPAAKPIAKIEPSRPVPVEAPPPPPKPLALPPLEKGRPTGVDKRTAQRLRRGKLDVDAVIDCLVDGIPLARMELLDEVQIEAVNRYSGLDNALQPTVFFEFHGSDSAVVEQSEAVGFIAKFSADNAM